MEKNKYQKGQEISRKLFEKTGDIRFHNMMNGFKELEKDSQVKEMDEPEREM